VTPTIPQIDPATSAIVLFRKSARSERLAPSSAYSRNVVYCGFSFAAAFGRLVRFSSAIVITIS
jgi:hypothetical protein